VAKSGKRSLSFWLSGKKDGREGRFIQIGNSLLLSKDFQHLGYGARQLYFCMAMEAGGAREFVFPRATAGKYGFSWSTAYPLIKTLIDAGYIELVSSGKSIREANRYRFCFGWKERAKL
jgi:hypothetical protein